MQKQQENNLYDFLNRLKNTPNDPFSVGWCRFKKPTYTKLLSHYQLFTPHNVGM